MNNPLQKYFRQPKIFIKLPSGGIYNQPGTIQGDPDHMPVYGMTGMDEIIIKTPDSLLTGESTATIVSSCCPSIKNSWDISNIDLPLIMAAIRIATYGPAMDVGHTCDNCQAHNEYEILLNQVIEYYMNVKFDNVLVLGDLVVKLRPLNYKESTEVSIKNFKLQQQIVQVEQIEDADRRQELLNQLFIELAKINNEIYKMVVESVEIDNQVVTERRFIEEWIDNCEKQVFDRVREHNKRNADTFAMPLFPVKCDSCGTEVKLSIDLDQSSFFVQA